MARLDSLRFLNPARLTGALRRRGAKATAYHAARRIGTVAEKALVGPDLIRINPFGYICNHKCPMCFLQEMTTEALKESTLLDRKESLALAEYQSFIDSIPSGLEEINVTGGGEPLAHPDVIEIMRAIKRRGVKGSLISNGTLLNEKIARALIEMRWDSTRLSVHAGDRQTYERIQGVDRFENLKENLKAFNRFRDEAQVRDTCELVVFHVLQRDNIGAIEKLFGFCEEARADMTIFERIRPPAGSDMELSADELKRAAQVLVSEARNSSVPCNLDDILQQLGVEKACEESNEPFRPARTCSVGFDQAFITATGDVLPCCFSTERMGNVRDKSFAEIWRNAKYASFRRRLIQGKFAPYCIENRCALRAVLHD